MRVPVAAARLAAVAVAGLAVGVATSYLQGLLPGSTNSLANSGAVWTVIAVALAAAVAWSRSGTVVAGLLALGGEVAGYYALACPWRGIATSTSERALWTLAALIVGPLAGLAAWWLRRGSGRDRALAGSAVAGLIAGEGVHVVVRIGAGNTFGWTEIVVGAGLTLVAAASPALPVRHRIAVVGTAAVAAGITYLAYGQTVLS